MVTFQFNFPNQGQGPDQAAVVSFDQQVRVLQIIRGSLILGVLFFLGIVVGLLAGMPKKAEFGLLEIVMTVFVVQAVMIYMFAPKFVRIASDRASEIRKLSAEEKRMALMSHLTIIEIVRGAVIEGATFFSLILILIADSQVGLIVGLILISAAVVLFPTRGRIETRIETMKFELGA